MADAEREGKGACSAEGAESRAKKLAVASTGDSGRRAGPWSKTFGGNGGAPELTGEMRGSPAEGC